jgi:hypothetical protein
MTLRLIGSEADLDLPARLRYDAGDPYAVRLLFGLGACEETVEWVFARELLSAGMTSEAGDGDVRIRPGRPDAPDSTTELTVELSSPSGSAMLSMPRSLATNFLLASYAQVWPGCESQHLDLDHAVESLLYNGMS